jgi:Tfp pilus assembly protein PilZ
MRNYLRHPSDIPIQYVEDDQPGVVSHAMNDVGYGGLSFNSSKPLSRGMQLHICIDTVTPVFETEGVVVWCKPEGAEFVIGMEFTNKEDVFQARMVEQICHIEHYKKEMLVTEGRKLTSKQAASEWISKFAKLFPSL